MYKATKVVREPLDPRVVKVVKETKVAKETKEEPVKPDPPEAEVWTVTKEALDVTEEPEPAELKGGKDDKDIRVRVVGSR